MSPGLWILMALAVGVTFGLAVFGLAVVELARLRAFVVEILSSQRELVEVMRRCAAAAEAGAGHLERPAQEPAPAHPIRGFLAHEDDPL